MNKLGFTVTTSWRGELPTSSAFPGHSVPLLSYYVEHQHFRVGIANATSAVATDRPDKAIGVLWLHGLGGGPAEWMHVLSHWDWEVSSEGGGGSSDGGRATPQPEGGGPALSPEELDHLLMCFPPAPHQSVTANGGAVMTSWFDIEKLPAEFEDREYAEDMARTVEKIHKELDRLVAMGVRAERVFVGGFSQGGAVSMQAGLRFGVFTDEHTPGAGVDRFQTQLRADTEPGTVRISYVWSPDRILHGFQEPTVHLGQRAALLPATTRNIFPSKFYSAITRNSRGS